MSYSVWMRALLLTETEFAMAPFLIEIMERKARAFEWN